MIVISLLSVVTAGSLYLWFLARTWWIARSASRDPGQSKEVIVFGKRLVNGLPDRDYRWRLRHALRLLRERPALRVTLAGGRGAGKPGESEAGRQWLLRLAPDVANRIQIEERSRDTIENLREVRRLLPNAHVALLSSRYHLARCTVLAASLGFAAKPCAAEPLLRLDGRTAKRLLAEAGYLMIFVVGRGWARLTGNTRMLSRIS